MGHPALGGHPGFSLPVLQPSTLCSREPWLLPAPSVALSSALCFLSFSAGQFEDRPRSLCEGGAQFLWL